MKGKMRFLLRADASPRMGTGHVMRSLALAQAARAAGHEAIMLGRINVGWVQERLRAECIPFVKLAGEAPLAESPQALLTQLPRQGVNPRDTWVVLDGYHFSQKCQEAVRDAGFRLLVIDDYGHLPQYSCDILLNQNPCSKNHTYRGNIGQKLMGASYALLREEFRNANLLRREWPENWVAQNILITLGGGNFADFLKPIASMVARSVSPKAKIRVIQGDMDANEIRMAFGHLRRQVEILSRVSDMAELLRNTDLCVTAGGSTCWELCSMGVPFLVVEVAENQREICAWLESNDIAPRFSPNSFKALSTNANNTRVSRMMAIVDGLGAERTIKAMSDYGGKKF